MSFFGVKNTVVSDLTSTVALKDVYHLDGEPAPRAEAQLEIFTPPGDQDKVKACLDRVRDLRNTGQFVLGIEPITLEEAEALCEKLAEDGIKIRFDWDHEISCAVLRCMPDMLHSAPLANFVSEVQPLVQKFFKMAALCDKWKVFPTSYSSVYLKGGSMHQPDAGWGVYSASADRLDRRIVPRVVFVVSVGQPVSEVRAKAWRFLYQTEHDYDIHVVIVFNVENSPEHSEKPCRFTLEIWVRQTTGNADIDFPMDDCLFEEAEPSLDNSGTGLNASASVVSERDGDRTASDHSGPLGSNDETKIEDGPRLYAPLNFRGVCAGRDNKSENSEKKTPMMWRRNEKEIVVFDESLPEQPKGLTLELDAYDFLRTCAANPMAEVQDEHRIMSLPLDGLQTLTSMLVKGVREWKATQAVQLVEEPIPTPQPQVRANSAQKRPRPTPAPFKTLQRQKAKLVE